MGFDKLINYYKIQYATLCITENPGCLFIATNLDARTHLTDAQEWAGNGSMVGAIKGAPPPGCAEPQRAQPGRLGVGSTRWAAPCPQALEQAGCCMHGQAQRVQQPG